MSLPVASEPSAVVARITHASVMNLKIRGEGLVVGDLTEMADHRQSEGVRVKQALCWGCNCRL